MDEDGPYDSQHLLNIDAWLKLFQYLDEPRDLISTGATCTLFAYLMDRVKINGRNSTLEACLLAEVTPLLIKWLPAEVVYNLRLACKRVKDQVDKVLDNQQSLAGHIHMDLFPRLVPAPTQMQWPLQNSREWRQFKVHTFHPGTVLRSCKALDRFEKHLPIGEKQGSRIKIVGSNLTISADKGVALALGQCINTFEDTRLNERRGVEEQRRLLEQNYQNAVIEQIRYVERAIHLFGHYSLTQLKYAGISWDVKFSYKQVYDLVQGIISSHPNLCQISLTCGSLTFNGEDRFDWEPMPPFRPLLPSPRLESISISNGRMSEAFLCQLAVKYGDHLRTLDLTVLDDTKYWENHQFDMEDEMMKNNDGRSYNFPALLELKLNISCGDLLTLSRINAVKLQYLQLDIPCLNYARHLGHFIGAITSLPSLLCLRLNICSRDETFRNKAMEELDGRIGRSLSLQKLIFEGYIFRADLPLRFFVRLFPNIESIQILAVRGFLFNNVYDPDLRLLLKRKFEDSRIWMEATKLEVVSCKEIFELLQGERARNTYEKYTCLRPLL